jgi:hypothetical protein
MADLLDVQRPVGQPLCLGRAGSAALAPQHLEGIQQMQHGPVVDRHRFVGGGHARLAALQEWEAVGVEQAAAVGGQPELLVLHPAVDHAEGGEQALPGGVAALQRLLAEAVGLLLELPAQGGDRVGLVVELVAEQEQPALLGRQQEHQPHHHGDGGLV